MQKNDIIKNKRVKACTSSHIYKEGLFKEMLFETEDLSIYTMYTTKPQTFADIKSEFIKVYKETLALRKQIATIIQKKESYIYEKVMCRAMVNETALEQLLKAIIENNIDLDKVLNFIETKEENDFNKSDLEFLQLILIYRGKTIGVPGVDKQTRIRIIKRDQKYVTVSLE